MIKIDPAYYLFQEITLITYIF